MAVKASGRAAMYPSNGLLQFLIQLIESVTALGALLILINKVNHVFTKVNHVFNTSLAKIILPRYGIKTAGDSTSTV
jgi:hypothetical protein